MAKSKTLNDKPKVITKDEELKIKQEEMKRRSYHNTELMLKHYRDIMWLMEFFPDSIASELQQPLDGFDAMIERLDLEMSLGNKKVENRLASIEKTRRMIDLINDALTVLKKKPNDGERLYELIKMTYIDADVLNHNEILYRLNLSSRQYYRLREQAIVILSLRLWSAPNKEIETLLELLSDIK